jgi:hypothetical protein
MGDLYGRHRCDMHLVRKGGRLACILCEPVESCQGSVRQDAEEIDGTVPILRVGNPRLGRNRGSQLGWLRRITHGRRIVQELCRNLCDVRGQGGPPPHRRTYEQQPGSKQVDLEQNPVRVQCWPGNQGF